MPVPPPRADPFEDDPLLDAAIAEIGETGSLSVTVAGIARRAGVSPDAAQARFATREGLLIAAMRRILGRFLGELRAGLRCAGCPRARLDAVVMACFGGTLFRRDVVTAWLRLQIAAQADPAARRILRIWRRRLRSVLVRELRQLAPGRATEIAETLGALIDGVQMRHALRPEGPDAWEAVTLVRDYLEGIVYG